MSHHPLNLAVRFLLELAALGCMGFWGWNQSHGIARYMLAVGVPLLAAVMWGVFRKPGDASSSGEAPVKTPGTVRLMLELVFFGFATWTLWNLAYVILAVILGTLIFVHYALSYDRIQWLIRGD